MKPMRYGNDAGKGGPKYDFAAPITRTQPLAVTDYRQFSINTPTNQVPDEFGITNRETLPMQQIQPVRGGKYSGRTGPIQ
jgi:hypothetical protein